MAGAPGKGGEAARPIIVKRIKKVAAGGHGGAWKIAYADFVTAMMAFFLLMWLLGSTAKGDLSGIAMYFQSPLQVAMRGGSGAGDASHVISGGGQDLTRQAGQVRRGDLDGQERTYQLRAAKAEFEREEMAKLATLRDHIKEQISADQTLAPFKNQIRLELTSEGLRVQIVDNQNRPMFALARAIPEDYTRDILHALAGTLNGVPNHLSISGHTDALPYAGGERGYNNWDLSTERANAAHRELVVGGLQEDRVIRIVGMGSAALLDGENPLNPMNRRISILVMNRRTEEAVRRDGVASVGSAADMQKVLDESTALPDIRPARPEIRPDSPHGKLAPPRLELTPANPSRH